MQSACLLFSARLVSSDSAVGCPCIVTELAIFWATVITNRITFQSISVTEEILFLRPESRDYFFLF